MHTRNTLAGECYRVDAETILQETPQMIDEDISMVAEPPAKYSLFPDFFSVPFPPIQPKSVPFIDLFAGIGGIRIPFDELGYNCVLRLSGMQKLAKLIMRISGCTLSVTSRKYLPSVFPHTNSCLQAFRAKLSLLWGK